MHTPVIIPELGKISGRDAIYLDNIQFESNRKVTLIGEFNGNLCEHIQTDQFIPYQITFTHILDFRVVELDLFDSTDYTASFEMVNDSKKIKTFANISDYEKLQETYQHYIFHTYDDVIELIATGFEIKLKIS